jgi:CRP-like cAMP-binding protein
VSFFTKTVFFCKLQNGGFLIFLKNPIAGCRHSSPMLSSSLPTSPSWSGAGVERHAAGSLLLHRGEDTSHAWFLESGWVLEGVSGAQCHHDELLEHQLGGLQGPCWLNPAAAVLHLPAAMDVVAQTDVVVRKIPIADFQSALTQNRQLCVSILREVASGHHSKSQWAVNRLVKGAEARCAEWLLQHAESNDQGDCAVRLQQRKRLIAAQLGIAPETLSRVLRHLRERRLISGSGRTVNLVDPGGLRSLAGAA